MVGSPLGHGLEAVRLLLPPHRDCFSRDAVRSGAEPEGPAGGLLFAFAPTLSGLVGPPSAMLAIAELHLDAMRFTPTLCRYLLRLILCGKALQQCFQPCQQALFIAIPERHLHLAASHSDVDVTACRSLWQCGAWLVPLLAPFRVSSLGLARAKARLAIPAAILCLHQLLVQSG